MVTVTYEEKMAFLDNLKMRAKLLHETCEACFPSHDLEILDSIMEDVVECYHQYKKDEKMVNDIYEEMGLKEEK